MDTLFARYAAESFWPRVRLYLLWSAALTVLFCATYMSTNWLADQRVFHFHLYTQWELKVPFVPWMIYVYASLNLFLALPLFVLSRAGIRRFAFAFALITVAASLIHVLLPTDLGWPRPQLVDSYPIFSKLFELDRPHNLVPSLHVGYSSLALFVLYHGPRAIRVISFTWFCALAASVLLVHQHHLLDLFSGLLLGCGSYRWFARPRAW